MKIAETKRLLIREVDFDDVDPLSSILSDTEVMKYSFRGVCKRADIENYVKDCLSNYKNFGFGQWAVVEKDSSKLIGVCGPNPGFDGDNEIVHFAARYALDYWGKGYASEALIATEQYSKKSLNLKKIYALVEPSNLKSIQMVMKNGFEFQKHSVYKNRTLNYYSKLL